jgi:hypothetical protein
MDFNRILSRCFEENCEILNGRDNKPNSRQHNFVVGYSDQIARYLLFAYEFFNTHLYYALDNPR